MQVHMLIVFVTFCSIIQAARFSQNDLARMWHQNGGFHLRGKQHGGNHKAEAKLNHLDSLAKKMLKEKGMFDRIIFKDLSFYWVIFLPLPRVFSFY